MAATLLSGVCGASTWFPLGPYGGDARSMAADPANPEHLFLGTATGWVYDSHNGGKSWTRVAQIANRNDLVVDHILVDAHNPKRLVVGAWMVDHPTDGGLYISEDYGKNWYSQAQLRGQSVRSLARSDSDPNEIVAGTLRGVFLSKDNGVHWTQISPDGSTEIHEVESVAIDPVDPNVIYAGTWHLPWKTTDGGATWHNIKQGVIDDSDVFSIIVDPKDPQTVYASACSGIYKSADGGELFHKVQGIPSTARRTRTLEQDPEHLSTVYAGTTEGLYRTLDGGAQWERLTPANVIVNDVYVDPKDSNQVLIATDRGGVYRSDDGGSTFEASNDGFSARQVIAYAADPQKPDTLYVGVVNDKTTGGVFESTDGGVHWQQQSEGLGGRDVFSLVALGDGTLLAGTEHGIFRLNGGDAWTDSSVLGETPTAPPAVAESAAARPRVVRSSMRGSRGQGRVSHVAARRGTGKRPARTLRRGARVLPAGGKRKSVEGPHLVRVSLAQADELTRRSAGIAAQHKLEANPKPNRVDTVVYGFARSGDVLFAASAAGLLRSADGGVHWAPVSTLSLPAVQFLAVQPTAAPAASGTTLLAANLNSLAISSDEGATWTTLALPAGLTEIGAVGLDADKDLWVGGREGVWYSTDAGASWKTLRNLFLTEVDNIYYDASNKRMLVTASNSPMAFSVQLPDYKVSYADTGWKLRFVRPVGDHLVGATLFDGMVIQPEMVDSAAVSAAAASK